MLKIDTIGVGANFCKPPLLPACWLVRTEKSTVLIGAPSGIVWVLRDKDVKAHHIDMIIPLGTSQAQMGGLDEIAHFTSKVGVSPILAGPEAIISKVLGRLNIMNFIPKMSSKILIKDEYHDETISFVKNPSGGYSIVFEEAKILLCGETEPNEEWLHRHFDMDAILHQWHPSLKDMPVYIQTKIWIYGSTSLNHSHPLPMMVLPTNKSLYSTDRASRLLLKNRCIRETS